VIVSKNWFITGASAGFGFEFVRGAAGRGDRVVATSRSNAGLKPLVEEFGDLVIPVELDVTDKAAAEAAIREAATTLGSLDIVVNNAGYGHFGRVEELSEDECQALLTVVDAERPPLRILVGAIAAGVAPGVYERRPATWKEWDELARSTDFPKPRHIDDAVAAVDLALSTEEIARLEEPYQPHLQAGFV
jgi:nucleoside-diphosphate-sugar epimerase